MLLVGLVLNIFSSYFLSAIFGNIIIFFLSFFALIVLNLELLSIFQSINSVNILILEFLFFCIAFLFYKKNNFPKLQLHIDFKRFYNSFKLDKGLLILSLAFVFLIIIEGVLAYLIPACEPDSQTYHFFRVYQYIKQHSLNHFETNDIRALVMPINSEIIYAWMLSFKKNFYGYGLVSYVSYFLILISSFDIMEKFKIAYRKRLFAIFVFSSLSAVIIQMASMQTDLLVGSLLLSSLALFLKNKKSDLYFSSLALALAMGTKSTGVISLLSIFILFYFIEVLIDKNKKFPKLKMILIFLIPNFIIFSSYNYILNFIQFHNFLGSQVAILGHGFWGGIEGYFANLIHYIFQWFDFTGFKWGFYLNNNILILEKDIFNFFNINYLAGCNVVQDRVNIIADEQISGFGILGFLVFIPMIFKAIFKKSINKNTRTTFLFMLALVFILNALVLSGAIAYMVYSIRFFVTFTTLSFIVLVYSYSKKSIYKKIIILFCLFYMLLLSTHTYRAPFFHIIKEYKKCNFNSEIFEEKFFRGKIKLDTYCINEIYDTILTKYKDKKNIAVIKTTKSVIFYLKKLEYKGYNIDFLNSGLINYDKLKKYDLLIVENKQQDDNVFNYSDIKINYKIKDKALIFNRNDTLNCYCTYADGNIALAPNFILYRYCFAYQFITKDADFKLDYRQKAINKEIDKITTLYYFVHTNSSL